MNFLQNDYFIQKCLGEQIKQQTYNPSSIFIIQVQKDNLQQMEWQFRKVLENFQTYKKAHEYRSQIQKGDSNILKMTVREIELILSQPKQKIKSKVLAMRFVRDIMILGRQDVVQIVQKLVPHLLKVCSYELQSDDPNRGETFFHQHPAYLKTSKQQQRTQIDQLGSTYMILCLESILHWGKWIPMDQSGHMSIYAKAYNDLMQRGVTFPSSFHYYKQSDTEKFKNTYKVQFFTDSYYTSNVELSASSTSRVSHQSNQNNLQNNEMSVQSEIFEKTSITTIGQIKQFIQQLYSSKQFNSATNKRLQSINKRLQEIYQQQFSETKLFKNKQLKQLKLWTDKFLINYAFYANRKIDFKDFLKKVNTEEIQLDNLQEQSISIMNQKPGSNVKMLKSPKKQILKATPSPQQLLKKQQYEYRAKIIQLKSQIQQKNRQIQNLNQINQKQKREITEDYERRMQFLKGDLVVGSKDKDRPLVLELEFQNQQLKRKIHIFENQLLNAHTIKQQELQTQKNKLDLQVTKLKIQNERLITIINQKNQKQYKAKLSNQSMSSRQNIDIFAETSGKKFSLQKIQDLEHLISDKDQKIKKLQKTIRKTQDDLQLFKTQLNAERSKKDSKTGGYLKKIQYFQNQNRQLKEKLHQAKKTIDVKDVEIIDLKEDLRRYQTKLKDINEKRSGVWSEAPSMRSEKYGNYLSPDRATSPKKDPFQTLISNKKIRFSNYEDLYLQLKPVSKQSFLRLCRSSLKKKDILFKENQLEIGVISETLPDNKVSFLLHLTNVAEKQIQNIRIQPLLAQGSFVSTLAYELSLQYIFCIQPQQQEKVQCVVTNNEPPYIKDRAVLTVSYEKNGVPFSHNIFLPFMIPKFFTGTRPSKPPNNARYLKEQLIIRYTKKMLPKPSYIKSYFQNILQRIQQKKYEIQLYHKDTDLNLYLSFSFGQNETLNIEAIVLRQKINEKQKYILEQILGFIEVAFRK